jgi:transglutaminase-like putative cysteine protease
MRAACLDRHWSEEKAIVLSPDTEFHDYRMTRAEELVGDASMNLFRTPVKLFRTIEKASTGKKTGSEKRLDTLVAELKGFAAERNLNTWQRACLTKCVSANMIDYVDTTQTNFFIQPARILERGEGVCKQYAMLGEYVGRQLGVQTKLVSDGLLENAGHVFLRVKINGNTFYSEPQNGSCEFYRTK